MSEATPNRLLAWSQEPVGSRPPASWIKSMTQDGWEALDQGRWVVRAMRSWQTASFDPPAPDRDPEEPFAHAAEVLLHALLWLACVDQALARYPHLDRVALEPPTSPPTSLGGPTARELPRIMIWRTIQPYHEMLMTDDLPLLPSVEDLFAGYRPALAHQTDEMCGQIQDQLVRWCSGGAGQAGISRRNVQDHGAQAMGMALRQVVRRYEERRVLQATLLNDPATRPPPRSRL